MTSRTPNRSTNRQLTALALAVSTLVLAACGGGDAEAPPASVATPTDTTAPVLTITDNVAATTASADVTFTFAFNEDVGTTFTVDLVAPTSPVLALIVHDHGYAGLALLILYLGVFNSTSFIYFQF